ncbi:MAG: hypothetical protein IJJ24_09140 [Solobacterium sp.]|nr:hypothetical protein [Solobacterium sp.]
MAVFEILAQMLDSRHGGNDCDFNGYLEDYLSNEEDLDPILKEAFHAVAAADPECRICAGLLSTISRSAISNQIIRYKDVFKLVGRPLRFPYLLYTRKDEEDRALLITPAGQNGYLLAKGYYYCMTEPGGLGAQCQNEIVAVCAENAGIILKAFEDLLQKKAGAVQRGLDHMHFSHYEDLKEQALKAAEQLKTEATEKLERIEDRTALIYEYVIQWFLLKKVVYVQYMVNKDILNKAHEGNVHRQRNQAKLNADEVSFLSYSEMWRIPSKVEEL